MVLFATSHITKAVHGILVGSTSDGEVIVNAAVPVCDETPTRPLIDIAEALVEAELAEKKSLNVIVGWFMSPEILSERVSDPVAMRAASVLTKSSNEGVLLVLQNEEIGRLASDESTTAAECIRGFGRDFGKQWTKIMEVSVLEGLISAQETREEILNGKKIESLTDHWQQGGSSPWHPMMMT